MAPLRFILLAPSSEVGIYAEEMGKQSILRISCCSDQFTLYGQSTIRF